jgi:predicted ATPase
MSGENDKAQLVVYALEVAEQSLDGAFGPERATWIQRLVQEYPTFTQALANLVKQGELERAIQFAYLLQELWFEDDYTHAGREWFARLLAFPQATGRTTQRARALGPVA